ncbi:hypothetical protein N7523_002030 [Penicillium sp. IBT 18751x]|nr:hypothetical protein N7523_002030 [Penicillium sp. IBT 18751x]
MDHFRRDGLGTIVLAIIALGRGYYDLAVVEGDTHLNLVASHYMVTTYQRLERSDPLLTREIDLSVSDSLFKGLSSIRNKYILAKKEQLSLDEDLSVWFDEQIGRLNELLCSKCYIDNTPWE